MRKRPARMSGSSARRRTPTTGGRAGADTRPTPATPNGASSTRCAYAGLPDWARRFLHLTVNIVKKSANQVGFNVLPRRWIVERSIAWLMRARRNCRDYERLPQHAEAHITWANITLMTRGLDKPQTRQTAATAQAA